MRVVVDATTLVALGTIGELDLLGCLDGDLYVPAVVREEVTTEPARTNVERFVGGEAVADGWAATVDDEATADEGLGDLEPYREEARELLGDDGLHGDVAVVAVVLAHTAADRPVGVVSDDRRVRTVARGLGTTVTGTVGVVVRAVEDRGLTAETGRELVRRVDGHGLHMTGELRETAYELVEEAAGE